MQINLAEQWELDSLKSRVTKLERALANLERALAALIEQNKGTETF